MSAANREANRNSLDEYLQDDDMEGAKDFMLTLARDKADTTERNSVSGRDDALQSLAYVEQKLNEFIDNGGKTGLLTGNLEKFREKILKKTSDSNLAETANEIAIAIQTYRKAVSGAAFTEAEAKEYTAIFPSIGKSPELNKAKINSLRKVFNRNQETFYKRMLGIKNYEELFADSGLTLESSIDEINYVDYLEDLYKIK